ncbi:hypothetical protein ACFVFI_18070 [Streptomyces sp. NPDC057705]|uniref:hypothetical protein n=1 Tax=Streptomyces sp. NPDC057705 TaxID=3346222 RepID=UPI0036A3FD5C
MNDHGFGTDTPPPPPPPPPPGNDTKGGADRPKEGAEDPGESTNEAAGREVEGAGARTTANGPEHETYDKNDKSASGDDISPKDDSSPQLQDKHVNQAADQTYDKNQEAKTGEDDGWKKPPEGAEVSDEDFEDESPADGHDNAPQDPPAEADQALPRVEDAQDPSTDNPQGADRPDEPPPPERPEQFPSQRPGPDEARAVGGDESAHTSGDTATQPQATADHPDRRPEVPEERSATADQRSDTPSTATTRAGQDAPLGGEVPEQADEGSGPSRAGTGEAHPESKEPQLQETPAHPEEGPQSQSESSGRPDDDPGTDNRSHPGEHPEPSEEPALEAGGSDAGTGIDAGVEGAAKVATAAVKAVAETAATLKAAAGAAISEAVAEGESNRTATASPRSSDGGKGLTPEGAPAGEIGEAPTSPRAFEDEAPNPQDAGQAGKTHNRPDQSTANDAAASADIDLTGREGRTDDDSPTGGTSGDSDGPDQDSHQSDQRLLVDGDSDVEREAEKDDTTVERAGSDDHEEDSESAEEHLTSTEQTDSALEEGVDEESLVRAVTRGPNLKNHFRDHKALLENMLDKKYGKWKTDEGQEFLDDLGKLVQDGTFKYEGTGTLPKPDADGTHSTKLIFRSQDGLTLVLKPGGEFQTLLETGRGMEKNIKML